MVMFLCMDHVHVDDDAMDMIDDEHDDDYDDDDDDDCDDG